uniref:Coagulation factor II (thrombin) receptor-like 1, tandem duplicate 1 n=1 Tax=Astyanax mexicanus TaxID=7994 RepID=A0A3B1JX51_ASTMX
MDSRARVSTDVLFFGFNVVGENKQGVNVTDNSVTALRCDLTTVFLPLVYIIVYVVGLPTNAMAIWVFLFRMKKKHPASILLANLALADLLFIIWLPLKIHYHFNNNNWIFGEPLCKVLMVFFYGNMYCSTIFIACISVQRYWAVAHPFSQKMDKRLTVCVSVCVWIVVWIMTIPLYLYDQTVKVENLNITTCHDVIRPSQLSFPVGYFLTMGIVGYVVPCLVCIVAYLLTFRSLRKSATDSSSSNSNKKKAIILMVIVLVMFLVCFTPSNIMLMVHYARVSATILNNGYKIYIITLCLGSLNSCLDPFVYYFISDEFREHVKNTLKCRSERSAKQMKVSFKPLKFSKKSSTSDSTHTQSTTYTSDSSHTQSNTCTSDSALNKSGTC